jgi:putative spermidine/putrescine transport system substrate-binding protein
VITTAAFAQSKDVSVMSFGGAYQKAQQEGVFKPYTAKTGGKVSEQEYGGAIAKIKAMVQAGAVTVGALDVDAPTLRQGCDAGLFEKLNYSEIGPKAEWIEGTATECGVGTIVYATILTYDGAKLKNGPTKIADLFDTAKFPGKRGLWKNPVSSLEFALIADGVAAKDVYKTLGIKEGEDRAFKKLDTIKKDIVWWEAGAQPPQLLASGEVVGASQGDHVRLQVATLGVEALTVKASPLQNGLPKVGDAIRLACDVDQCRILAAG